jgi:hypothetical protein
MKLHLLLTSRLEITMKSGFAAALSDQMKVKGWDIAKLAREIETSYEYARRLTVGRSFPSRFMLKGISKMLGLDQDKMWTLIVSDKIQQKYGSLPGQNPRVSQLEPLLPDITEDQFQTVLGMVEGWAGRNRKNAVEAKTVEGSDAVDNIIAPPTQKLQPAKIPAGTRAEAGNAKRKYRTHAAQATKSRPVHPGILKSEETKEAKR